MEEIWKVIKDAPNYSVSNLGRVKNNKTEHIMKTQKSEAYERVGLRCIDGKSHTKRVHRLVLEAFDPQEDTTGLVVNHIDADHFNNKLENLEWITQSENVRRTWERGRKHINEDKNYYVFDSTKPEEWKPVADYNNYEISTLGRVRVGKQILKPDNINHYLFVRLNGRKVSIHRLMMKTFQPIENADEMQVNHIDGNKHNNQLDNLEWCTQSENIRHMHQLKKEKINE